MNFETQKSCLYGFKNSFSVSELKTVDLSDNENFELKLICCFASVNVSCITWSLTALLIREESGITAKRVLLETVLSVYSSESPEIFILIDTIDNISVFILNVRRKRNFNRRTFVILAILVEGPCIRFMFFDLKWPG